MRRRAWLAIAFALVLQGCNFHNRGLVINEVMATNDNAWHDEWGEDEDYIELLNTSDRAVDLSGYVLTDGSGERARLPDAKLPPGATFMMVADASPEQGPHHLPFKLSSTGDVLVLGDAHGFAVERLELPPLAINATLQRFPDGKGELVVCEHASPAAPNGASCPATKPKSKSDGVRDD